MKNREVDGWLTDYDNPQKDVLLYIREVILASDSRIEECIKWKSPTFTYKGNIASFNPRSKKHTSLMFHTGASIPGEVARFLKITDLDHAKKLEAELVSIFKAWCDLKD